MCDCYCKLCECREAYVDIHISDFSYPREVIPKAYCPKCAKAITIPAGTYELFSGTDGGTFAFDQFVLFKTSLRNRKKNKLTITKPTSAKGCYVLEYQQGKTGPEYLSESVEFNGSPMKSRPDVCIRKKCRFLTTRKRFSSLTATFALKKSDCFYNAVFCSRRKNFIDNLKKKKGKNKELSSCRYVQESSDWKDENDGD